MKDNKSNLLKNFLKISTKYPTKDFSNTVNTLCKFLSDEKDSQTSKSDILNDLTQKLKTNRYLSEYFSTYEKKSIYLFLFDLYLMPTSQLSLKAAILNLIKELVLNIEINKQIFDYLFQKLASIYRSEEASNPDTIYNYLTLLSNILGDTDNYLKPRNYFSCVGNGNLSVDLSNKEMKVGTSFSIILNFKVAHFSKETSIISKLITINFSNNYSMDFDLQYPNLLIVKELDEKPIKTLPNDEWINLLINVTTNENKLLFFFYVNGENTLSPLALTKNSFTKNDCITSISFFNNFYGEVSSMVLLSQKEPGNPGVNKIEFLEEFKSLKEGIWDKRSLDNFIIKLKNTDIVNKGVKKLKTQAENKTNELKSTQTSTVEKKKNLSENIIFIFAPFNFYNNKENVIKNVTSSLELKYTENIRPHKYQCYQKKLELMGVIPNILPIAEMYLVLPKILTEKNLEILIQIITNIVNNRTKNMEQLVNCEFFKIFALFLEKYPESIFTSKILTAFFELGECMFKSNMDKLTSNYFEHILLNEKILSKYNENLQIEFWKRIIKFFESDSTQIDAIVNMKRLSLILRFYDRNKYTEMCCSDHLNIIKDEFKGVSTIMNPPISKKLAHFENFMYVIIKNAQCLSDLSSLFKILTLDLSPCLTKFILKIFITVFQNTTIDENWKKEFVIELIKEKFDDIIINTFIHCLPDVRLDILQLIFEIQSRVETNNVIMQNLFKVIEFNILPQSNFYSLKTNNNSINIADKKDNKTLNKRKNKFSSLITKIVNKYQKTSSNEIKEQSNDATANNLINEEGEFLILKEKTYYDYISSLMKLLIKLSLNLPENTNILATDFNTCKINNILPLELLISIINDLNDNNYTMKIIQIIEQLTKNTDNANKIILSEKIIFSLLTLAFLKFKNNKELTIYEKTIKIISNSFLSAEVNNEKYPFNKIDTILMWADQIIQEINNIDLNNNLNEFLNEVLFECLKEFKAKNESLINFDIYSKDFDLAKDFNLKNYFIFLTHLFNFSFHFKYDLSIKNDFLSLIPESNNINDLLKIYINAMIIDKTKEKISEYWKSYKLFDETYNKLSIYWNKIKNVEKKKCGKIEKYKEIFDKIKDKNNKNIYQKELELLFYEEKVNDANVINPLINMILIIIMCILSVTKKVEEFKYWLKELKKIIRFIIISSSNLTRNDQNELEYNKLQEKCSNILLVSLCFLKNLNDINNICKEKVDKVITSIYILCFIIADYQYNKHKRHEVKKALIKIVGKFPRNDLSKCAVFLVFNDILKEQDNRVITDKQIETLANNKYDGIPDLINQPEWTTLFYENKNIKQKVLDNFYTLNEYKKVVDERYELLKVLNEEYDDKYEKDILELLPLYEKELDKHSNNSLEINKQNKHIYKVIKKKSFSWGGYWSDRKLFYEKIDNFKVKLINHYTKTLMKPILVPIVDVSYYLPQFSGFDPKLLFNDSKFIEQNKIIMDIDKILKEKANINMDDNKKTDIKNSQNENFLRKIYFKSNEELANKLSKIADKLDFGKEEDFIVIKDDTNTNKTKYYLGCLVKTSHHIKGVCFIDNDNLNFKVFMNQKTGSAMSGVQIGFTTEDDDYDKDRQTCFGSYFVFHQKDKDLYKISIKYSDIKWIFKRKYYYKNSAFEIYTTTNKSYYFNLKYEEERETVLNEILTSMGEYAEIIDDMRGADIIIGYKNLSNCNKKNTKKLKLSKKIDSWKEWQMTNYELLMWLNIFGNRSFNDISQYPVFPWVLSNFEDPLKKENGDYVYREMTLPMGMMELNEEGEKRKELYMLNYETLNDDEEGVIKPYFFGSNYSNPVYVCTYLVRLFPFTHISIELQGKKFDDPNRLFISIENSFYNSTTQKTDVRELIPEFFYLPEMLLNVNDLNMGVLENGNKVNDVLTPCDNNPYEFVKTMRSILEGDIVSNSIQNWIDLIFGSKASGEEAKNAHNLFSEASYQENIDFKSLENKESHLRLVEFGLIPSQVLNKDFVKKDKKEEIIPAINSVLKKNECKTETGKFKFYQLNYEISILTACENEHGKLVIILNNGLMIEKSVNNMVSFMKYTDKISGSLRLPNCYNYMFDFYSNNAKKNLNKSVLFFNNSQKIIMSGFYDSKISIMSIKSLEHEKQIDLMPFSDDCPILSIAISQDEEYLFVGNSIGNILVYKISPIISNWTVHKIITDQMSAISHIHCCSEMNLWCSTSVEGYVNIYTLPECKLIRSLKTPLKKSSYAFLSSSPLPAIVVINNDETSDIFVYSINGKLISKKQENFVLTCPIIMKDKNSNDYLAYVGVDEVIILNLPNLEVNINVTSLPGVYTICPSEDKKILYAINKNAYQVVVIKDDSKANKSGDKRSLSVDL